MRTAGAGGTMRSFRQCNTANHKNIVIDGSAIVDWSRTIPPPTSATSVSLSCPCKPQDQLTSIGLINPTLVKEFCEQRWLSVYEAGEIGSGEAIGASGNKSFNMHRRLRHRVVVQRVDIHVYIGHPAAEVEVIPPVQYNFRRTLT